MKPELRTVKSARAETDRLTVTVLYTTPEGTKAALKSAAGLAGDLGAAIRLVVTRVVPFPLPLNAPPVPIEFTERKVRKLARTACVDTEVRVYDCRDREETILSVLSPQSVVVIGGARTWFPTIQTRLARLLRKKGHDVVLVEHA